MGAVAPVICSLVLIGLLAAWVTAGGAGTIAPVRIQVTLAAVPMPGFTASAAAAAGAATSYLTIRNRSASPDELLSADSPISARAELTRQAGTGAGGPRTVLAEIVIPGRSAVTLSPFGNDVVFLRPAAIMAGEKVALTLTFRHAGKVTIEATVTPPGTP
jgi:copper(I)-binding protein